MVLYVENPKEYQKIVKTLRINKFSTVVGYKTNIQKLVAFLYTKNELTEKLRKQSPYISLQSFM